MSASNLVWMDLEMTGLDPDKDVILEMATIITDAQLNIVDIGPNVVIRQPETYLSQMDAWNVKHHTESGLLARIQASSINTAEAEQITLDFIKRYTVKGKNPLCGNTISQDRRFLYKYMPHISEQLNYRNIDVSTIKELFVRWYPYMPTFQKQEKHMAYNDIQESIAELKYYRSKIFVSPNS